ncbi:MAG: MFS transporter [Gemmataceae bacterium]
MNETAPSSTPGSPSANDKILFWASFATLIAAGIGFSVRGAILKDWGQQFGFTQSELGTITGGGLVGFGLAIIFFSFLADKFGYGKLMLVAFLLHASSAVLTFAATPVFNAYGKDGAYMCLYAGMWLFALGNGTCEAVINPLTATLFPKNKTHWLNILHAGWPLGLILGALIVLGFNQAGSGIRWELKLGVFLLPVLAYGFLMFGKTFPKSEAQAAGVPLPSMMKDVGLIGFTLGAALIGLALGQLIPTLTGGPAFLGWIAAALVWLAFGIATNFAPGHWILAFLYVLHAMVGYVELGTDSWITNITEQILENQDKALLAFIWTNVLMFTLRFFAGPIVEKINPIGLLFCSASLGVIGLYLLGNEAVDSVWPWIAAVTVYGVGKTFYWPTLLGVISERFPKGGALALGLSGGVGMIGAGILGGPGIGYKQDYFARQFLTESAEGRQTYDRYMARTEKGDPDEKGFPLVTSILPTQVPAIAGLDNGKLKIHDDYAAYKAKLDAAKKDGKEAPKGPATTLDAELELIAKLKAENKPVEEKLEKTLLAQRDWWATKGQPNFEEDSKLLKVARNTGAKTALLYTAAVPLMLAIGFMILIGYFYLTGGYKQVHLEGEQPMGEY